MTLKKMIDYLQNPWYIRPLTLERPLHGPGPTNPDPQMSQPHKGLVFDGEKSFNKKICSNGSEKMIEILTFYYT